MKVKMNTKSHKQNKSKKLLLQTNHQLETKTKYQVPNLKNNNLYTSTSIKPLNQEENRKI